MFPSTMYVNYVLSPERGILIESLTTKTAANWQETAGLDIRD